jgi:hypothetical protein
LPDLDLANWFAKPFCQTILPDLDLPKWFAKLIWHLYLQIGLPNHFARPRFAKMVCQTILLDLHLDSAFDLRIFEISQLPEENSYFVELKMQSMELSFMGHRKHLTGNEKGPSVGGGSSARKWEMTTISSMTSPSASRNSSAGPLSKPFVGTTSTQQELLADVRRTTWVR